MKHLRHLSLLALLTVGLAAPASAQQRLAQVDRDLLAKLVLAEARGEGLRGMALVARSVLNRAAMIHAGLPASTYGATGSSLREIIYARGQYQPVSSGTLNGPWTEAQLEQANRAIDLALDTARLRTLLRRSAPSQAAVDNVLNATGFRARGAFNDRSQNYRRQRVGDHVFNGDRFSVRRDVQALFDRTWEPDPADAPTAASDTPATRGAAAGKAAGAAAGKAAAKALAPSPGAPAKPGTWYVQSKLMMRSHPSVLEGVNLMLLQPGWTITVRSSSRHPWWEVELGGTTGFVWAGYLGKSPPTPGGGSTATTPGRVTAAPDATRVATSVPAAAPTGSATTAPAASSENTPGRAPLRADAPTTEAPRDPSRVIYGRYRVSDPRTRTVLERIAARTGRRVILTSGDRGHVPRGGSARSLHLHHRAADFYVEGQSLRTTFQLLRDERSTLLAGSSYEVIHHDRNTNTGGPHIHVGNYADSRGHRFKHENNGNYRRVP